MLPPVPHYGADTLCDVGPSLLAALGVAEETNALHLPDTARVMLFVVDGLGWVGLQAHADAAPYLSSMKGRVLTAGFPSTTVTSLASLGTGLPPGQHGLTGYTTYMAEAGAVVNWLAWRSVGEGADLRDRLVPEVVQPQPTIWERADAAGVTTTVCTFDNFADTGLTRAVLRGGRWGGTVAEGDAIARAVDAVSFGNRSLVYVYVSALDLVGHLRGPDTESWREQLSIVDRIAERLGAGIGDDTAMYITADHGMVHVPEDAKVDFDGTAALRDGVVALAGEPRMRHVHTEPGAAADVRSAWQQQLGDDWVVISGDEAVAVGLFGPEVTPTARARIGDVIALATGNGGVVERRKLPRLAAMPGQHGSLTDADVLVPLLSTMAG
jgi:hypothetical protein